jgi:sensor c-di-GMP phosphodiesterase-like protein
MARNPYERPARPRWRKWLLISINVAGLILIIPLLKVAIPLAEVWWHTRSQSSLQAYERASKTHSAAAQTQNSAAANNAERPPSTASSDDSLQKLTNQLNVVQALSDNDIQQIVAQHFGVKKSPSATKSQFDMDSAVFDSISKTTIVYKGTTYYGYQVNLVDQNGQHRTNIDCYTEPNLDYERSMATMDLINNSPQLKRIYNAMSSSLAEKSSSSSKDNDKSGSSTADPALRIDPSSAPK